jgi:RNA polymerase sigma factor (sigma-70 family)
MSVEKTSDHTDEARIWNAFKQGSEGAYAQIYENYFFALYNYGIKIIRDKDLVKDCIQDLFINLWRTKHNLGEVTTIKPYLYKSLRHDLLRKMHQESHTRTLHPEQATHYDFEIVLSHEVALIEGQLAKEQKEFLMNELNTLTKRQKEVIFLKFYENLSYQEIATVMSISVDAVYNLLSLALGSLKKKMVHISLFSLLLVLLSFIFLF